MELRQMQERIIQYPSVRIMNYELRKCIGSLLCRDVDSSRLKKIDAHVKIKKRRVL